MSRRNRFLVAGAAAAVVVGASGVSVSVGAQAATSPVVPLLQTIDFPSLPEDGETNVYAVHGLNLDGQSLQTDRGTSVTVCAGGAPLIPDFQFGDVVGPVPLDTGDTVDIDVFVGAGVSCDSPEVPLISQSVEVPDVDSVALVATSGPYGFVPELVAVVLPTDGSLRGCGATVDPGPIEELNLPAGNGTPLGRIQTAHVAAAPPVEVAGVGDDYALEFGETEYEQIPVGEYILTVTLDGAPIVGPLPVENQECVLTVGYVVGNQPLPEPTTPTTPMTPMTPTTAPPAAAAVSARPAFTG